MKPISRRVYALAAIALAVVIFVAINIAADAGLTTAKLDLTANGQFTLAQGTRNILANLKEPVTLRFYYSKQAASNYASVVAYAQRVRDLLGEYKSLGHGNVIVEETNAEPLTDAADEANAAGVSEMQTNAGDAIYFGLVGTNRIDGKETIAYFSPEREQYLEYDLTSLIYRLSTPKKTQVGIVTSLPLEFGPGGVQAAMRGQSQPNLIYQQLTQTYATQMLPAQFSAIPKGIDVLIIAHPAALGDAQLEAIDQFALAGGRVLVFVDPLSEMAMAGGANPYQPAASAPFSSLPRLFEKWGIGFDSDKVVGDQALAMQMGEQEGARNPLLLHFTPDNFDDKDPLTANLQTLYLWGVGALHPLKGATTSFAPLINSSNQASLLDATEIRANPQDPGLIGQVMPTGEKFAVAARVSGQARTAFPATARVKTGTVNAIVVADSDIFDDRLWVRIQNIPGAKIAAPFADNNAFVLNAVENLSGSNDMISLRTREASQRPFTRVLEMQGRADARFQQEEKRLQQHLTETRQHLHDLQQGGGAQSGRPGLSAAQQAEINRYRSDQADTGRKLRDVQHNLRKDIDTLGSWLTFVNIALMPILVAIFALTLAALRRRRRRQSLGLT